MDETLRSSSVNKISTNFLVRAVGVMLSSRSMASSTLAEEYNTWKSHLRMCICHFVYCLNQNRVWRCIYTIRCMLKKIILERWKVLPFVSPLRRNISALKIKTVICYCIKMIFFKNFAINSDPIVNIVLYLNFYCSFPL